MKKHDFFQVMIAQNDMQNVLSIHAQMWIIAEGRVNTTLHTRTHMQKHSFLPAGQAWYWAESLLTGWIPGRLPAPGSDSITCTHASEK